METVMQGEAYFDPTGPLRESWRKGDFFWALATDAQLAAAEAQIRAMQADGTLEKWFRTRDDRRKGVGQFTFFSAVWSPGSSSGSAGWKEPPRSARPRHRD